MKNCIHILIFFCASFSSIAQSIEDSIFYFDYELNYTSPNQGKWVSRTKRINDSTTIVNTVRTDTSRFLKAGILDNYTKISESKFIIERSFSKKGYSLPGRYRIQVDVINKINGIYKLDIYSSELNLHKAVYSKVLIPICPINKTIIYHPNCSIAKLDFHDKAILDSVWSNSGELITNLYYKETVDTLPVLLNNSDDSFKIALQKFIQKTIKYPQEAIEANIMGRVYISCIITHSGDIEHIEVVKGVHPLIDGASLDIFRKMKIKIPAQKDGNYVDFRLIIPITFNTE